MSSNSTGCVYTTQLAIGVVIQVPTGNNIAVSLDNQYDVMLYDVTKNEVIFYTKANQIILPNPDQYMLFVLNPESANVVNPNLTFIPGNPASGYVGYQFTILEPSLNEGANANGVYTIDISGVDLLFNPNVQNTYYVGYGNETTVMTNTLYSLSSLMQTLSYYFTLQQAVQINQLAEEQTICGTLIGSPDPIVFSPPSSGTQTTTTTQGQPFAYGVLFVPSVPPLPPAPPVKKGISKELATAGVVGALLVAGAIVSKKAK